MSREQRITAVLRDALGNLWVEPEDVLDLPDWRELPDRLADALRADRQIETPAQLAALPHLAVIRINPHPDDDPDDDESPVLEKRGLQGWYETGRTFPWREDQVAEMLPATLLWHPKDGVL